MVKYLEHRRHSIRNKPGKHLNQTGVDLARSVGEEMGGYDFVVTSSLERAFETAIAMGFAVDRIDDRLNTYGSKIAEIYIYPTGYSKLKKLYEEHQIIRDYANSVVGLYLKYLENVDEEQTVLVISHGGVIDIPLLALFPDFDFTGLGFEFDYCEGYTITFDDNRPINFFTHTNTTSYT